MSIEDQNFVVSQSNSEFRLIHIEAMLEVSISMQSQIIAKLEGREFVEVHQKAYDHIKENMEAIVTSLPKQ